MKKGIIIIFKETKKKKRINVSKDEYIYWKENIHEFYSFCSKKLEGFCPRCAVTVLFLLVSFNRLSDLVPILQAAGTSPTYYKPFHVF